MRSNFYSRLFVIVIAAAVSSAQSDKNPGITGTWIITANLFGTPSYLRMELKQDAGKLSGTYTGDKLTTGTVSANELHFVATSDDGTTSDVIATLNGEIITGKAVETDPSDKAHPMEYTFTAERTVPLEHKTPKRHEFTPTVFYRQFSPSNKPVLRVAPGDIVHTTTVDAGGSDEKGVRRVLGGNPETGPFYIEGAEPGDALVVHLLKLHLNRDYAISDDSLDERAMTSDLAVLMKDNNKNVRWHLDLAKGVATLEKAGPNLANYTVPLKPMLGCIATAVGPSQAPPPTGDSGGWGGNMDFNEIAEGATIYLPVSNPGALLYLGDGHAAQGDGELNGNALETSLDVEFSVDVIPHKNIGGRRIETATHIISMGLSPSLNEALRNATENMADWLKQDYNLTPSEIALVLGTAAEYRVSEVADRNSGVILKIGKPRLSGLIKKTN